MTAWPWLTVLLKLENTPGSSHSLCVSIVQLIKTISSAFNSSTPEGLIVGGLQLVPEAE